MGTATVVGIVIVGVVVVAVCVVVAGVLYVTQTPR